MPNPVANSFEAKVFAVMDRLASSEPAAVAVSGGGDSLALMHLMRAWSLDRGRELPFVVTVDHALRPGSDNEANCVAGWAGAAGFRAVVLTRRGALPEADVEAAARAARFRLIGDWARGNGVHTVYLAHTRDDQAETLLMRLMRGSGVDGLSAMRPVATYPLSGYADMTVMRPLLSFERNALRNYLKELHQAWIEDPMNEDPRFTRVRIRQAWPALERLGFDASRLAATAMHLARARDALEAETDAVSARICRRLDAGMLLDGGALARVPSEIGLRVLVAALMAVGGEVYRPRFERLERLFAAICAGELKGGRTLHGCRVGPAPRRLAQFGPQSLLIKPEARQFSASGS